ncbi:hypothetical protein [Streptomyces sp. NBC_01750]|uniref:hypothetical protein n=1 Tax=Streptomyces sp. NBC_01750 TaxID=2975928 RepID=UPI002DDAC570|nr:hypothetical protein [Streptomyces sp. NBC_01750]WSD33875.1 hypothetical protein OG966_19445 [Streptomyces sp. NBC_01750]
MNDLTLNNLTAPLRVLRMLAVDFPDLPAVHVHVSPLYPDRLELSLHHDIAGFEAWRAALAISPDAVTGHVQGDGTTLCLEAAIEYAGATVQLVGYAPVTPPSSATDRPGVARPVTVGVSP